MFNLKNTKTMNKIIILGTPHLSTTPGKRSVDGRLKEYLYGREIVSMVESKLKTMGYIVYVDYKSTEPNALMQADTYRKAQNKELAYRVGIVNKLCKEYGSSNCVYISIHVNAASSDGKWHNAKGFSVFVCPSASSSSRFLAKTFTDFAKTNPKLKGNRSIPSMGYWTSNLYVLRNTLCPAVLTENLFQDNQEDVDFLLSEEGKNAVAELHVKAILKYCERYN